MLHRLPLHWSDTNILLRGTGLRVSLGAPLWFESVVLPGELEAALVPSGYAPLLVGVARGYRVIEFVLVAPAGFDLDQKFRSQLRQVVTQPSGRQLRDLRVEFPGVESVAVVVLLEIDHPAPSTLIFL